MCNCVSVQVVSSPAVVRRLLHYWAGVVAYSPELQSSHVCHLHVYSARYVSHNLQSFKQGNFRVFKVASDLSDTRCNPIQLDVINWLKPCTNLHPVSICLLLETIHCCIRRSCRVPKSCTSASQTVLIKAAGWSITNSHLHSHWREVITRKDISPW